MTELYLNGKKVDMAFYKTLPSTNTHLKEECKKGAPNYYTVIADSQSSGRGRLGRSFVSGVGGLYMSFLFKDVEQVDILGITAAAGVSAAEAIDKIYGVKCGIKWVNDLILDGKKVCGILAEGVISDEGSIEGIVIGIGVNIAPPDGGFPYEIKEIAGAVSDRYSYDDRNELAKAILEAFNDNVSSPLLPDKYRSRSTVISKDIRVIGVNEAYNASVIGIDDSFGLVVKTERGEIKTLNSGEISIRLK